MLMPVLIMFAATIRRHDGIEPFPVRQGDDSHANEDPAGRPHVREQVPGIGDERDGVMLPSNAQQEERHARLISEATPKPPVPARPHRAAGE